MVAIAVSMMGVAVGLGDRVVGGEVRTGGIKVYNLAAPVGGFNGVIEILALFLVASLGGRAEGCVPVSVLLGLGCHGGRRQGRRLLQEKQGERALFKCGGNGEAVRTATAHAYCAVKFRRGASVCEARERLLFGIPTSPRTGGPGSSTKKFSNSGSGTGSGYDGGALTCIRLHALLCLPRSRSGKTRILGHSRELFCLYKNINSLQFVHVWLNNSKQTWEEAMYIAFMAILQPS